MSLKHKSKSKYKWDTLSHNGVLFPPLYVKHNVPITVNINDGNTNTNKEIVLEKDAEEAATMYAKCLDTEYVTNPVFRKNFWKDWKKLLGADHPVKSLEEVDFKLIYDYLIKQKQNKQDKQNTQKDSEEKYKFATVNGVQQPVGNFRMEPPGIFIGRGCHPKLGRIKKRVLPKDITINIGKGETVPKPDPETTDGLNWGSVIHDRSVEWLASWREKVTGKIKYVWLGTKSTLKAENDKDKYDLARKLKRVINRLREINYENMSHSDEKMRQIATALYLIDNLALRVGNEKSVDEADTVGVTSVRVEHIKLLDKHTIQLDFLGKDSVRYVRKVVVDPLVHVNINRFMIDKSRSEELFDKINPSMLNKYLQSFMKSLTSKVFRTYNASYLFQKELCKISKKLDKTDNTDKIDNTDKTDKIDNKINMLLNEFNRANMKVALLCNHQKKVSSTFNKQVDSINNRIKDLKAKKKKTVNKSRKEKLQKRIKELTAKRQLKIEMKSLSLGTSKTNYIDPRITVAFIKKHNLPVEKIFSKALQEKFWWAFEETKDYVF